MQTIRVRYSTTRETVEKIFKHVGFSTEDAAVISDVLLTANLRGIQSHGIARIKSYYLDRIREGMIDLDAEPEVVKSTSTSAVVDGHEGMGQLISYFSMNKAIDKAEAAGLGAIAVKNSNHFGIAGYYSMMAESKDMIGITMSNTGGYVLPTFSREPLLGTNPISVAIPSKKENSFVIDMATSVVPKGKIEVHERRGEEIPSTWALDRKGREITDPSKVLQNLEEGTPGGLLPIGGSKEETGGHKGYGFSILIEVFSALLSGGLTSNKTYKDGKSGLGHFFMALDVKKFRKVNDFKEQVEQYLEEIQTSKTVDGKEQIFYHGEKEYNQYKRTLERNEIAINPETYREIQDLCESMGIESSGFRRIV